MRFMRKDTRSFPTSRLSGALVLLAALLAPASADDAALPGAADTDPARAGWMTGSPPPVDKLVLYQDFSFNQFPRTRWSFSNMGQLLPTKRLWRGDGPEATLPQALRTDLDSVTFKPVDESNTMRWEEMLSATYADAVLILYRGEIVYERYFGVTAAHTQHLSFSMTKSYYGTVAAMLLHEGVLEEDKRVSAYIPELAGSGFGDATVRQALDMTTGIRYREDYTDMTADVFDFARAGGIFPQPPGYDGPQGFYAYLPTLQKAGAHGEGFKYRSVNTEVVGWLIARVTGDNAATVIRDRIWRYLGAEEDAYLLVDSRGTAWAAGGMNATARDHARFGEMMRLNGKWRGRQIVPRAVVDDIRAGGNKDDFAKAGYGTLPGFSYRNQWWVHHNDNGAFSARGVHGQTIYIDPSAEMVIVRLASHPLAANANYDDVSLPAYQAIADHLSR